MARYVAHWMSPSERKDDAGPAWAAGPRDLPKRDD